MNTADAKDNNYGDLMHEISEEMRQLAHVKARKSESKLLKNQQLLVGTIYISKITNMKALNL